MNNKYILGVIFCFINLFFNGCFYEEESNENKLLDSLEDKENIIDSIPNQLIIVLTNDSNDINGYLYRYEGNKNNWSLQGNMIDVTIGKKGMAKGRGIEIGNSANLVDKIEGDGKTPSGIFTIGDAFGFQPIEKIKGIKLNYLPIDSFSRCIEDAESMYYNKIVQINKVNKDWDIADKMRNVELYEWGFFVNHNTPSLYNSGSCVFFHIWRGPNRYTLGCTAMSKENILKLLYWIDPIKNPLIIQYVISDYNKISSKLNLPDIILP